TALKGLGGFDSSGPHTYADAGTNTVTVHLTGPDNQTLTAEATATVAAAPLTATAVPIRAALNVAFAGVVATFTDANPGGVVGDYTATIDWGDGENSTGTVASDGQGGFTVSGTHTYEHAPTSAFDVQIAGDRHSPLPSPAT